MNKLKEEDFGVGIGGIFEKRIVENLYNIAIHIDSYTVSFNLHELRWAYLENGEKTLLPSVSMKNIVSKTETIDNFHYLYIEKNMDFEEIIEKVKNNG